MFRSSLAAVLACAALLAAGTGNAVTPVMSAKAKADKQAPTKVAKAPEELKFSTDGKSATAKGAFKGPKTFERDYRVPMKAGQTLEVTLTDQPGTTFAFIYRPGAPQVEGEGRKHWKLTPTVEGDYVVHVFLTRSAVEKGEKSSYELSVTRK